VATQLTSDPSLFTKPQRVTATTTVADRTTRTSLQLEPAGNAVLRIPVRPNAQGICVVRYDVAPTAVPADVIPGSSDDRELGAHFNGFALEPS
jgi:hypothetical protein